MSEPILIELLVEEPLILAPVNFVPVLAEPLFMASEARLFQSGDKAKLDQFDPSGLGGRSQALRIPGCCCRCRFRMTTSTSA